jgi:hypothetical protein
MVDTHEMQNRCMEVVNVDAILDRVPPEVVGGAVRHPALNSAAGKEHREPNG